nr:PREDICTED: taste receptor type 1 member 3-like [Latimeria chalumnae]|eukprot:XP_014351367.1 PREDICTED: taste receptor type 1 member 3-like [Latimeria chalumnae]
MELSRDSLVKLSMLRMMVSLSAMACGSLQVEAKECDKFSPLIYTKEGDYILGGLFPVHEGFAQALAMKFVVEKINNSTSLLPGVKLGYEIYDTCQESVVAIQPTLLFLTKDTSQGIEVLCNYTDYRTRVAAVIGPSASHVTSVTGKLLSFFLIPQVSYDSSSVIFNNKINFPSFFRTVPSDSLQSEGMISLIKMFNWTWIAAIGSNDVFGKTGLQEFSKQALRNNVCIAFQDFIPVYETQIGTDQAVKKMVKEIEKVNVAVVVLFASSFPARVFLQEVIQKGMKMVWIAVSSWSLSELTTMLPGVESIGTVLGFAVKANKLSEIEDYIKEAFSPENQGAEWKSSSPAAAGDNTGLPPNSTTAVLKDCSYRLNLSSVNMSILLGSNVNHLMYHVTTAVYSIAHALHNLLKCNSTTCQKLSKIYSWQLLDEVKNVNFSINNSYFYYDKNGNPNIGYDILSWTFEKDGKDSGFQFIGDFQRKLNINKSLIKWHTKNKTVTNYNQCKDCPEGQWSAPKSTSCSPLTFIFLTWGNVYTVIILIAVAVLLALIAAVSVLFFKHLDSPVVQASGGKLNFFTLLSLASLCCSVCFFFGKPNDLICWIQQPYFSLSLTACLSAFLVKSIQIVFLIEFPNLPKSYIHWLSNSGVWVIISANLLIQAIICASYLHGSERLSTYLSSLQIRSLSKFMTCTRDFLSVGLMIGHNGVIALVSFMCTFMAQKPAQQYNMARDITFSMLLFFVAWIIFIPTFAAAVDAGKSFSQIGAILGSALGILVSSFLPKCYIILFKPDLDVVEYFQIYIQ